MLIETTSLSGVVIIKPKVFSDDRGYFLETYHRGRFKELGIPMEFVQDNQSYSRKNTLRGLHYQVAPFAQAKLVRVVQGRIWDVAVDIRPRSSTFGQWTAAELSDDNHHMMYVPDGFAHGFYVLSDEAVVTYKCSAFYAPDCDRSIRWNDNDINIQWPLLHDLPNLSDKDKNAPLFRQINRREL